MAENVEHAPLPWARNKYGEIVDAHGVQVVVTTNFAHTGNHSYVRAAKNEEMILRACNTHEQLVAALKEMVDLAAPNIYPQPDKPDSAWAKLVRARGVLAASGAA